MRRCGIIKGDENGCFNPKSTATRAEAAAIFVRLFEKAELDLDAVFDISNVKSIEFSSIDEVTLEKKEITVDAPDELKAIIEYFANGELKSHGISGTVLGNHKNITLYDNEDRIVCTFAFTESSILINGFRYYSFSDNYLKVFCDKFSQ